jgi:hypothetical protein
MPMTGGPFLRTFAIGLGGSIILGLVFRDIVPVLIGMAIVGIVAGLVADGPRGLAGVLVGQVLSLAVLWVIQFGTDINTLINTEEFDQLIGFATLIIAIWLGFLGIAGVSYIIVSTARTRMRSPAPR